MDLFDLGRILHSGIGCVALVAFWVAALSRKGGDRHRSAGRLYLAALAGVMALSSLMVAGKALAGDPALAVFLAFLISMVGTASWLTWFAVRYRRRPERLLGPTYRVLATWLIVAGSSLFALGLARRLPLTMFLSLLGAGFGVNMWRLALLPGRDSGWWLAQHMNGVMLNFIATHDSFLALGVGSVVPELRQGVPRMLIACGLAALAIVVRVQQGLRYQARERQPAGYSARSDTSGSTAAARRAGSRLAAATTTSSSPERIASGHGSKGSTP
jgi:hypothetical protein